MNSMLTTAPQDVPVQRILPHTHLMALSSQYPAHWLSWGEGGGGEGSRNKTDQQTHP